MNSTKTFDYELSQRNGYTNHTFTAKSKESVKELNTCTQRMLSNVNVRSTINGDCLSKYKSKINSQCI
jgi:hypothetical protein